MSIDGKDGHGQWTNPPANDSLLQDVDSVIGKCGDMTIPEQIVMARKCKVLIGSGELHAHL